MSEYKLRWNCEDQGCFNIKKRLKFDAFTDVLPRKIGMSDVDGLTEINGNFLFLEWKEPGAPIPLGQEIMFKNLTRSFPATVVVVSGDAEYMQPESVRVFFGNVVTPSQPCNLEQFRERLRKWGQFADGSLYRSAVND